MDKVVSIQIAGWLACAVFVIGALNQVFRLWNNFKGEKALPANEHLGIHQDLMERRIGAVEEVCKSAAVDRHRDLQEAEHSARVRSAKLYEKIDETRKEMTTAQDEVRSEMQQGFKDMERALGRLEGKIGDL